MLRSVAEERNIERVNRRQVGYHDGDTMNGRESQF